MEKEKRGADGREERRCREVATWLPLTTGINTTSSWSSSSSPNPLPCTFPQVGGPIEARAIEDQTRGPASDTLRATAESYLAFARSDAPQYAHITPAERETVAKEASAALEWLNEKLMLQVGRTQRQHVVVGVGADSGSV